MDDAGCTADSDADPDATAMAVQALHRRRRRSAAEASDGLDYLAAQQGTSGGVGGGGPTSGRQRQQHRPCRAGVPRRWPHGRRLGRRSTTSPALQYGCDLPAALRGGIAYDPAAVRGDRPGRLQGDTRRPGPPLDLPGDCWPSPGRRWPS